MEKETAKRVHLGETKEIDLPSLDITKYIGKTVRIEKVEEFEGDFGYYVKMTTEIVDKVGNIKDKEPLELRASKVFGLQTDETGNVGWGAKTKLGAFLKKHRVEHYKQMVGKNVILQSVLSEKTGKEFLTF